MSSVLRQFHIISSLKSNYDQDVIHFYKAIAPVLSKHTAIRKMHTQHFRIQSINRNLQLKLIDETQTTSKTKKPLAVILAWMMAKERHIEKFRSLYFSRGFDVLTVYMAPKDLLFPVSGSQVIAKNVLDYFISHDNYKDIIVHAFSVGAYLMGEMFVRMRNEAEKYKDIHSRIQGVILDSAVDVQDMPAGLARALTKNPITMKVLEWYVSTHLALMYNVATKHYQTSSKNFHNTPLKCPALFFVSEADKVGSPAVSQMAVDNWQVRGVDVKLKCWKDSKHVSHLYKHQDEYIEEVDKFLSKVNLISSRGATTTEALPQGPEISMAPSLERKNLSI